MDNTKVLLDGSAEEPVSQAAAAPLCTNSAAEPTANRQQENHPYPLGNGLTYFIHVG
ncbi:MAG: hypothetical protein P4L74_01265 [Candidatus Doudnabacteria bacterium]|nr:hypothetical protein [Candidatus Doudnabacteria bacterium]